jgi:hypothetical protein
MHVPTAITLVIIAAAFASADDIHTAIYNGCGAGKACFGSSEECVANANCSALGTVQKRGEFSMTSFDHFQKKIRFSQETNSSLRCSR